MYNLLASEEAGDFVEQYFHLLTNPAHIAFELTLMIIIDGLLIGLAWPIIKNKVAKHDREVHGH